jgi:hypothetical protein
MRYTHFPTPWDELCSSRAGTLLYGFNQQLTNPKLLDNWFNGNKTSVSVGRK